MRLLQSFYFDTLARQLGTDAKCKQLIIENTDVHVLLGSRDKSRGEQAVSSMKELLPKDKKQCIELLQIDASSDESVSNAAKEFSRSGRSLYGVVNNAGIGWGYTTEETLNTNYWGIKRVNDALSMSKTTRWSHSQHCLCFRPYVFE